MVKDYDLGLTSGGIGPTHDDITYASLAKAFSQPLKHDDETLRRMHDVMKDRDHYTKSTEQQRIARERMALFPAGGEVLHVTEELWVPIVRLGGRLCVFPGVPFLFRQLLDGLTPYLPLPDMPEKPVRHLVRTRMKESQIAPFLAALQERVKDEGIRIGSYPSFERGVTISLIGKSLERLQELSAELEKEVEGEVVTAEQLDQERDDSKQAKKDAKQAKEDAKE